jgi:rRNA maturation RNase YbeY
MGKIQFDFVDVTVPDFKPVFFRSWLNSVAQQEGKKIDVLTYIFVRDEFLFRMNATYLNHQELTDVITFNYNEGTSLGGDCFISFDRVKENALIYSGGAIHDELCRVMVHGLLHLIGYSDKSNEQKRTMRGLEDKYLQERKSFT